jgi:hypothetical protein
MASWGHLEEVTKLELSSGNAGLRLAPKLSLAHIYLPLGKNMSVKLAAQLLSHSVAAGKKIRIMYSKFKGKSRCIWTF